jgi:hypothetical protein
MQRWQVSISTAFITTHPPGSQNLSSRNVFHYSTLYIKNRIQIGVLRNWEQFQICSVFFYTPCSASLPISQTRHERAYASSVFIVMKIKAHFHWRKISTDRKFSENAIVKSWKFLTSKFFPQGKFVSANHIIQNFHSAENFPEWKRALRLTLTTCQTTQLTANVTAFLAVNMHPDRIFLAFSKLCPACTALVCIFTV